MEKKSTVPNRNDEITISKRDTEQTSEKQKIFNFIPERIDYIQKMIKGQNIESIIDFRNSTESFEYPTNVEDIRELLPKKIYRIWKSYPRIGREITVY